MGRPRKRPHVETAPGDEAPSADAEAEGLDWSFLDAEAPSLSFFDLLVPDFAAQAQQKSPAPLVVDPALKPPIPSKASWHFDVANIDFEPNPLQDDPLAAAASTDLPHLPPPLLNPDSGSLTSHSVSTPDSHGHVSGSAHLPENGRPDPHSIVAYENRVCGCLASMYLALDSLQHLPKQVGPAMRVVRNAARTAHDTVSCRSCSPTDLTDVSLRPPVQAFQNMMMLGALLPTIANAYNRILALVDDEAARADAQNRLLAFSLEEYGGLWGRLAELEHVCGASAALNGSVLDALTWRRTVRALLRCDVYGIHNSTDGGNGGPLDPAWGNPCLVQIGLKDIIAHMDERSRLRHASMDAALAAGILTEPQCHGHMRLAPGEKHTCQRIIDIARMAIDALVIA